MINNHQKSRLSYFNIVFITMVITMALMVFGYLTYSFFNKNYAIEFSQKNTNLINVAKFNLVKDKLMKEYYQDVNENILLEGAVRGMAEVLNDPYTVYYTKEQMSAFMSVTQKSSDTYVGIGVQILLDNNGNILITQPPFQSSPAEKAGIKMGDIIIKVDGKDITSYKDDRMVVGMIKGKEGTNVDVTVYRPSETKSYTFTITRKKLTAVLNIWSKMINTNVGYISIRVFDEKISENFIGQVEKLKNQGMKALIIDVRDDPGGLYGEVVKIADYLLPKDTIVYTENRSGKKEFQYSDENSLNMPISVLVNGSSASASEILAGALKDNKKGVLVGTKTFGKGLVQTTYQFKDGSGLKLTIQRYFTPSGVCIQGKGIQPDFEVILPEKYNNKSSSSIPANEDPQLSKAIDIMMEKIGLR